MMNHGRNRMILFASSKASRGILALSIVALMIVGAEPAFLRAGHSQLWAMSLFKKDDPKPAAPTKSMPAVSAPAGGTKTANAVILPGVPPAAVAPTIGPPGAPSKPVAAPVQGGAATVPQSTQPSFAQAADVKSTEEPPRVAEYSYDP